MHFLVCNCSCSILNLLYQARIFTTRTPIPKIFGCNLANWCPCGKNSYILTGGFKKSNYQIKKRIQNNFFLLVFNIQGQKSIKLLAVIFWLY